MLQPDTAQNHTRRIPALAWLIAAVMVALLGVAFYAPIARMVGIWDQKESYYSHGWLVPFVALYLVWRRRTEFVEAPRPSWLGLGMLLVGIAMLIVSGWLVVFFTAGFALILTIWGLCGFLFGPAAMKRLSFPAFILLFMVPPPEQTISQISLDMKLLATKLAIIFIDKIGIVAAVDGQTIYLGNVTVTVGAACSGLRSLISLIFLGVLFAYFSRLTPWRKIGLALLSIPIAIVSNVVRIVTISLAGYWWGQNVVEPVHDWSGYLVFVVAFFLLYAAMRLLYWRLKPAGPQPEEPAS